MNEKTAKEHLASLTWARSNYMEILEEALLPCSKSIADLRALSTMLNEHRTEIVRDARLMAEALRKREGRGIVDPFAIYPDRYPDDIREQKAREAEELLKGMLDTLEPVDALRRVLYYYVFTNKQPYGYPSNHHRQ